MDMKKTTQAILILLAFRTLNSCTTFHTPISRELVSPEFQDAVVFDEDNCKVANKTDLERCLKETEPLNQPVVRQPATTQTSYLANNFDWPVDEARLTRGYLPNKRRPHLGLDLAAPRGTPIFAAQKGTVIYAGREFKGYGKMVLIENGYGWATLYAHFDKIYVQEGQVVQQGELLGGMGKTGRATGYHLHFEIRKERGPVDPLPLLPNGINLVQKQNS